MGGREKRDPTWPGLGRIRDGLYAAARLARRHRLPEPARPAHGGDLSRDYLRGVQARARRAVGGGSRRVYGRATPAGRRTRSVEPWAPPHALPSRAVPSAEGLRPQASVGERLLRRGELRAGAL